MIKSYIVTVVALNKYTLSREERRFLYFNHLSKEFLEESPDDLCSKMYLFQALFLDLQIQQLTILKPGLSNEVSFFPEILWKDG